MGDWNGIIPEGAEVLRQQGDTAVIKMENGAVWRLTRGENGSCSASPGRYDAETGEFQR